ncbi:MAG: inositol monophosphatase [Clostridia bacterium]|nr:inositol monophosphatase [Clostridia bacterium]
MYDKLEVLDVMEKVARECGKVIKSAKEEHVAAEEKTDFRNLVTSYDLKVQELAVKLLSEKYPGAAFFCEENDEHGNLLAPCVFIIDPIDGTANFANHMNMSCISIGCFMNGVPTCGAVFDPYADELYSAAKGCGAKLNGRPIHVTDAPLEHTLVMFGTAPYNLEKADRTFEKLKFIFPKCMDVRRRGSAEIDFCTVACGRAGLFFEEVLSLWDFAAGMVILEEAGGEAYTMSGDPLPLDGRRSNVVAGPRRCIDESELLIKFKDDALAF